MLGPCLSWHYCSALNSAPTSAEPSQWTTVRGSIIIHIPTLSLYYYYYYCSLSGLHKRYWAEIFGVKLWIRVQLLSPELIPNSHWALQMDNCSGEHYSPHSYSLSLSTTLCDSHLLPSPTEKVQLLCPNKRYWAKILGISSNSPNLIFGSVLVNPIGSSN